MGPTPWATFARAVRPWEGGFPAANRRVEVDAHKYRNVAVFEGERLAFGVKIGRPNGRLRVERVTVSEPNEGGPLASWPPRSSAVRAT